MTPEVLALFILDALFVFFATITFFLTCKIILYYDKNATTTLQYKLEKQSYLSATIIKYIFVIKIPLLIFFIFTLEKISIILPGAMCAAGVVNATDYGIYLLLFKVLNLYLFAYWIVLDSQDMKNEKQPYSKVKFQLFAFFYLFLMIEIILEILMFSSIDIKALVDCCGVVFSSSDGTYMAQIIGASTWIQTGMFYAVFALLFLAYVFKMKRVFSILNILFLLVALITLIGFFGTYIYEMPHHHCPFCFLQKEYNYIGYFLYIFLFLGTFWGLLVGLLHVTPQEEKRYFNLSLFFNSLYLIIATLYVLIYYIKNSLWL